MAEKSGYYNGAFIIVKLRALAVLMGDLSFKCVDGNRKQHEI
jgi:hypothetical protein